MSEHVTRQFEPQAASAAAARRFVRETLLGWGADDIVDDALLLTNELVTNAVVHAGTEVQVSCALGPGHVQISVTDNHASRVLPATVTNSAPDKTSGRGLYLMMQIADGWGAEYDRSSKRVWFRLPVPVSTPTVAEVGRPPAHFIELGDASAPIVVAVVETDISGVLRHWSAEAETLLGWPADDVLGRPLAGLVTELPTGPDEKPLDSFENVLAQPRWCGEYVLRGRAGADVAVFASQMHAHVGEAARIVTLLVPAQHRAVLMPGTSRSRIEPESTSPVPARPGLLSLDALLELAVEHSRDLLEGDVAYALLVTDDDVDVELRALAGLDRAQAGQTRWPKPPDLSESPEATQPKVYADVGKESLPERFLADVGMHALVTAPLLVGDRVFGRVGVAVRQPGGLTGDDAGRLQRSIGRFSLAVESARLNELERVRRGRLSYLAEASDLLAGMLDPDMAAALTAQLVVPRLADWCAVYLLDQPRTARLSCVWHAREDMIDPLRRLLTRMPLPPMDNLGRPQQWPELRERLGAHAASPADLEVAGGPTVTVTLMARGRPIGALIAGRSAGADFRTGALDTLDDLCRRAAWSLDNARLYVERSTVSDTLQRSLLPASLPTIPGLDVGIAYEAAGEGIEVGGDFYDVFEIDANRWGFAVGDVCGKGSQAAAVTGLARHSLRVLAREHNDIPTVLRRLNATILSEGEAARFVTLLYGEMFPTRSGIALTFAVAGHPLPILVGSDGSIRSVGRPQPLLGVFREPMYQSETLMLRPGEHLVATTDGVTDRRIGNRTLGERGLLGVLRQTATLPASAVATRLRQAVLDFGTEPLQDDFAVMVLQPYHDRD